MSAPQRMMELTELNKPTNLFSSCNLCSTSSRGFPDIAARLVIAGDDLLPGQRAPLIDTRAYSLLGAVHSRALS